MIKEWSEEEIKILRENYSSKGSKHVAESIGRSREAVMAKAVKLQLHVPPVWSEEEIKFIKRFYKKRGAKYVAKKLGKKQDAVIAKAGKLGIRYNGLRSWEIWEDNYLRRHYYDREKISISRVLQTFNTCYSGKSAYS
ncbi:MAG: hypothetical protein M5T52_19240 [Ignavibacteriaceae bacterium]|nr:hypothetical protein [Ignavibacteriaceae bacterium]